MTSVSASSPAMLIPLAIIVPVIAFLWAFCRIRDELGRVIDDEIAMERSLIERREREGTV